MVATTVLFDVEIYNSAGQRVYQRFFNHQRFATGQTRAYPVNRSVPAGASTGTYFVKLGDFSPGWGALYHWNNDVAQITVIP